MKILHIIPGLGKGGAERLVLDICTRLAAISGIEIKLFCFSGKNDYYTKPCPQFIEVIPASINLSVLHKNSFDVMALEKAIKNYDPDVIHTHLFEAEIVSRSVDFPKARWFSHCHDNMKQFADFSSKTLFNKQRLTNFYEKKYLLRRYKKNGGTHFIAISTATKGYFELTVPQYPVTLLHNAIDYMKFYNERKPLDAGEKPLMINVGSMVENKNQEFLLLVADIMNKKGFDFELHFLGDGVTRNRLESRSVHLGLSGNVYFHGSVNNIEDYLRKSNLYVHSAKSEALGLTIIEAMASGLPVITLDGRGNRDLIEQDKNGYMIFEHDPEKFANHIIELWQDRKKYHELSSYAQQYARQYDIQQYVDSLLEIYSGKV